MYKWREGLKKGDKVVKRNRLGIHIVEIASITPAGSLKLEDGDLVKPDSAWSRDRFGIEEFTEKTKVEIERQIKVGKYEIMKKLVGSSHLTNEELDIINKILDKKIFYLRSVLGEYLVECKSELVTSRQCEEALLLNYDEAEKLVVEVSNRKNILFNIYSGGSRVK